ncbi:MAG: hypothetical protein F4110_00840 [Acidimicrobiaceae bacterium]|nr:hypothetical protein [Acidimicrobiaceae bacterium]MXZ98318.1 hypothetical protein [Acidimicrobiaceae bacterium]MYE75258.1 hypothetical protein [Acidimicrobiaceae bacterium]MYE97927.1 hypothetical protein [Acidimicrobiaceae bacterium]MYH42431.1 hypothetical protein [Acidimicrobiaceae bacterium]
MSVVSAIHASAAVLLVVAGAAKLSRPAQGVADLLGFRAPTPLVRLVGASEAAVGIAALLVGGPAAWAVGLLYATFAVIVGRAVLVKAGSCGCFGRLDAPPSRVHVLGNLALAGVSFVAAGAAVAPVQAIAQSIGDRPAVGAALVAEIVLVAGLGLVAFTALPEALGARTARAARHDSATLFRSMPPPAAGIGGAVPPRAARTDDAVPVSGGRG